jgi:two-component system copper resistance phosphate regulon response regulator CusR
MRVLIEEDQVKMANYLDRVLVEQGYAVDVAHTGREALEWAAVVEFGRIVLDIMLPEMDGLTVYF